MPLQECIKLGLTNALPKTCCNGSCELALVQQSLTMLPGQTSNLSCRLGTRSRPRAQQLRPARASAGSQTCLGARAARILRRQPAVPQGRRHMLRASAWLLGHARRHIAEARSTALPKSRLAAAATSARSRPSLKKTSAYFFNGVYVTVDDTCAVPSTH